MRALERFLIAFTAIALGMRIFHSPTAPVFVLIGFPALALYYILVFPFLKRANEIPKPEVRYAVQMLTGIMLALAVTGFGMYTLGWINRGDVLGNCCVILGVLLLFHGISFWKRKRPFALEVIVRAGVLLAVVLGIVFFLPPFAGVH